MNRFLAFNPEEQEVLRVLLNTHINTVSEIAVTIETRVSSYLAVLEELENELMECWRGDAEKPGESVAGCAAEAVPSGAATADESAMRKPDVQRVLRGRTGDTDSPAEVRRPSQRARRRRKK